MTRRLPIGVAVIVVVAIATLALSAFGSPGSRRPTDSPGASSAAGSETQGIATATQTTRPKPGDEVFGFVPYWEMNDGIEAHVAKTDLTTLALFSVTSGRDGTLDKSQTGYKRITGGVGKRLIQGARDRGDAVQLVLSSLGAQQNARLFG